MNRFVRVGGWLCFAAWTLVAAGCHGGSSTLKGSVRDSSGTQGQTMARTALTGSVAAATHVRVSSVGGAGSLNTVASANLAADGTYQVTVPSGETRLVIEARDANESVLAAAIVDSTGDANATVTVEPIDRESTIEERVFVSLIGEGVALTAINPIDVRLRVDANLASAVSASADSSVSVTALTDAVKAAQTAQIQGYTQAGLSFSQDDLFQAELASATTLDAALDASSTTAYSDFSAAFDAALVAKGISAKVRAKTESGADVAFRGVVKVRLGSGDSVTDASVRASAGLEAHTTIAGVQAILSAAGASSTSISAANSAGNALEASLSGAGTATAAASDFSAYVAAMTQTSASSTLGSLVGVSGATQSTLDTQVLATGVAAATLDTAINATFNSTLSQGGAIDASALASGTVAAYAALDTTIQAQAGALTVFQSNAQPTLDVLIVVRGSAHAD